MRKVYKTCDGNCTWIFHPNTLSSSMPTPKLGPKWTVWGLLWPKSHVCMIVDCFRSIPKSKLVHKKRLQSLGWNRRWHFKPTTTFSAKLTPCFGQKRAAPGLIWPKLHVSMAVDCCRSTPKSILVHEKGLQSLGWESCMVFLSKYTIYCQADPQIWSKMTNSGATLAQMKSVHGYSQLQNLSKV